MNIFKKLFLIVSIIALFFLFNTQTHAAAPDGLGPWADNVPSSSQGLMKNGLAVPALRSNPNAALGVAENNTVDSNFFSLGFGGNIVLGFDNGISSGVIVVEATNPNYPGEVANIEVSENGTTWVNAGTIVQDGSVDIPEGISCAKFVRITDTSDSAIMPDAIADGYDVDGVQAIGDACNPPSSPTPTPAASPASTPASTPAPSTTTSTATSNVPGFPNTGGPTCTATTINTIPNIIQAGRVSPTSVFVSWGPDAGFNNFIVEYGFADGNWQFSTKVAGFSTTINDLPPGQSIWIHVAATDNCAVGTFGGAVQVGSTPQTNVPGFPNTGNSRVPRLPNTGIDPASSVLWGIPNSIFLVFYNFLHALGG